MPTDFNIINNGKPALVVENLASWHSLTQWNNQSERYSAVIFGIGNSASRLDTERFGKRFEYFGDLDIKGVNAAKSFTENSENLVVTPAIDMYAYILEHGLRREKPKKGKIPLEFIKSWFGSIAANVYNLLDDDEWICQETLGADQLRNWLP